MEKGVYAMHCMALPLVYLDHFVATCKHKKRKLLLFAHLSFIVHLIARSFTKYLLSRIHANGAAPDNLLQNSIFQSHRLHFEAGGAPRLAVY